MAQSNGGVAQSSRISAYPMVSATTGQAALYAYDPTLGFNDPANGSSYFYKVEEVVPGKTPTVNSLTLVYRDLGLAIVTFNLTGTNDNQQVVSATTGPLLIGNLVPTGRIMTRNNIGLTLTAQNLQLSWVRGANAGPVSIVKVIMTGQVEVK